MSSAGEVIFVLQVAIALGPIAVYFLGLGLVNSQARPSLVSARSDFLCLAVAFFPLLLAPVLALLERHLLWPALGVCLGVGFAFLRMMPRGGDGWVVYHIEPQRCRRLLERACRRLGWSVAADGDSDRIEGPGLLVRYSVLPLLRNVTLQIESATAGDAAGAGAGDDGRTADFAAWRDLLLAGVRRELDRESMLPSATGASLVVIGASLLGLPLWYLLSHMNAIVDVVRQILFA